MEIKESITIEKGDRIHEIWSTAFSIYTMDNQTWCELFKTKGFKRRRIFHKKIEQHGHKMIHRMLKNEGINWEQWKVVRCGSNNAWDVIYRLNQCYEIVKIK